MKKCYLFEIRRDLYLSLLTPHFNYCSETWLFSSKGATDKSEKRNERAMRFVFKDKHTADLKSCTAIICATVSTKSLKKKMTALCAPRILKFHKNGNTHPTPCSHQSLNTFKSCLVQHGFKLCSRQIVRKDFYQLQTYFLSTHIKRT